MSAAGFSVRLVPLNFCEPHRLVGIYVQDGTDDWFCKECVEEAVRWSEAVLRFDRERHTAHRTKTAWDCPYCNPNRRYDA